MRISDWSSDVCSSDLPALADEVFGAASIVIRCADKAEVARVLEGLEGQLTATLQLDDEDVEDARALLPILERKAGRILANGWPTGVEVSYAIGRATCRESVWPSGKNS